MTLLLTVMAAVTPQADSAAAVKTITLEQALQIALSENVSVKVADMEIEKAGYARKGTYSSLYPKIDGSGSYQRTIKKQVTYMDVDLSSLGMGSSSSSSSNSGSGSGESSGSGGQGFAFGRWNTWSAGVTVGLSLVNSQLWESLKISDKDVELAVEKARSSRIETVTQVKQAYFSVLLAKEAFNVYKNVYENAVRNLEQTQMKYNAQRASELDLVRAKTSVANAVPNVFDAENSIELALWQLKAVMGVNLDDRIDVAGALGDYSSQLLFNIEDGANFDLAGNSTMRQLALQAEQLAMAVKVQQNANIPTLSLGFSYMMNSMANDFNFNTYNWDPYSYVGLTLSIPIFSGFKRSNEIKKAKVQASELDVQRINTERQLKISIRQYLNTMETQMKSYSSSQSALESATKAYDIASKSYNVGRSTLTDLDAAQLALTQAQLAMCQTIYYFIVAKSGLEGVLGSDFISGDGSAKLNNTYAK